MAYALTEEPIVLDLCQKRGLRVLPGPIRPSDASQHVCDRRVRGIETLSRHPVCRRNRGHSAIEGRDDTSLRGFDNQDRRGFDNTDSRAQVGRNGGFCGFPSR